MDQANEDTARNIARVGQPDVETTLCKKSACLAHPGGDRTRQPGPGTSPDAAGPAMVLYIEDDPVNALLMQAIFGALPASDATLVVACTAADGLHEADRLLPELILLDMNLPDLDGLSVLRALRSSRRTARIPVIAVSADTLPEQIQAARDAGVVDYWTKPIRLKRVHAELARRFPAPPTGASPPAPPAGASPPAARPLPAVQ